MNIPNAFISYLVEFHASRDFFECHELLEEYWKEHPEHPYADTWVGLIQLAVGLYHQRRGNLAGARKMLTQAKLRLDQGPLEQLGLDKSHVLGELSDRLSALDQPHEPAYTDFNLRITAKEVMARCEDECRRRQLVWGSPSRMDAAELIHRHKLRDRSDVIAARQASYEAKQKERGRM
jgi:predicted metal-dependent hydrolase